MVLFHGYVYKNFFLKIISHEASGYPGWETFSLLGVSYSPLDVWLITFIKQMKLYRVWLINYVNSLFFCPCFLGYLYPTSMRIHDDGRLVVSFRTEARFRGQFVASHPSTTVESMVVSPDHPDLTFNLELTRSDPTFEQPNQEWSFVSDLSVSVFF